MSKMQTANQPALSRRAIRTRLLLTLIYAALVPYLIYRVATSRYHLSAVNALLLAALSPAVGSLIEFVRKRQLSVLGLLALVGIAAKAVSALLFNSDGKSRLMGQKDNHVMEKEQRREAKQHLVVLMHQGISWKEAIATVGVHISRSTAYRWVQGVQSRGEAALLDGRHGHPTKLREAVLQWLVATCRANPQMPSREVQAALQEQFDIYVSIGHLNRVRGQLGIENHRGRSKKNSKRSLLLLAPNGKKAQELCSSSPLRTHLVC